MTKINPEAAFKEIIDHWKHI